MDAYGGRYSTDAQEFTTTDVTPTQVLLPTAMTSTDVDTATNPNALTITNAGDYEITYNASAAVANAGNLTFALRNNAADIPGTVQTLTLTANNSKNFGSTVIVPLTAGNVIDMVLTSTVDNTDGTVYQASLMVKKLN